MRRMIWINLAVVLVLSTGEVRAQGTDALIGTYTLVSGKEGEKDVPKDHLNGAVRITSDTITMFDQKNRETYVIKYRAEGEGSARPLRVAMTITKSTQKDAVGSKARGLIKTAGNTLTLIYDFGKGGEYPKNFEPRGDTQHLFVLRHQVEK
jgi:uncharacterized protein (TIGR03067 family)